MLLLFQFLPWFLLTTLNAIWNLPDASFYLLINSIYDKFLSCCEEFPYFILDDSLLKIGHFDWEVSDPNFDLDSDAALMFTSGTTAHPRAVRITHRNIQANTESIIKYLELSSEERMMVILPFFYCFGASLLHTHLRVGASLVLSNTIYLSRDGT